MRPVRRRDRDRACRARASAAGCTDAANGGVSSKLRQRVPLGVLPGQPDADVERQHRRRAGEQRDEDRAVEPGGAEHGARGRRRLAVACVGAWRSLRSPVTMTASVLRRSPASLSFPMVRLIVFDLDGTLIDSRRDLADSANALLATFDAPPLPDAAVVAMVGRRRAHAGRARARRRRRRRPMSTRAGALPRALRRAAHASYATSIPARPRPSPRSAPAAWRWAC